MKDSTPDHRVRSSKPAAPKSTARPMRAYGGEGGGKDGPKPDKKPPRPKPVPPPVQQAKKPDEAQRIAKVMARAGLCSRRDAEGWIAQGRVDVNGITLTSPAFNVAPGDRISVDGQPLAQRERTRLFAFHKPRGLVTTDRDPEGRATIFEHLATVSLIGSEQPLPRTVTIGRLDINTEGLLLLTNDGGLARVLELPSTGWLRRYRVRANGTTDQSVLDGLRHGVMIDGIEYAGIEATLDRVQGANVWLTMGLREGKNREVKRVLEHIGLAVTRLIRISFGPFQLAELGEGEVEEIRTRVLKDQLGPNLIAESGADFESASEDEAPSLAKRGNPAPQGPVPRDRPQAGPRKHVSTLRAERDDKRHKGARAHVESSNTEDRKGRAVKVERIVSTRARPDAPASRNARRFANGGEARPARDETRPAKDETRPAREGTRPAREGTRPAREGTRPAREGTRPEKKHFRGGAEQGAEGARGQRAAFGAPGQAVKRGAQVGEKRFARSRPGGTLVDNPHQDHAPRPRSYGKDRPRDERSAGTGQERNAAPAGSFKGARRFSASGKPFSEARERPSGGKPRGEKPFRAAPDGKGRPGNKPGGRPPRRPS